MKASPELRDIAARLMGRATPGPAPDWNAWLEMAERERLAPLLARLAEDLPESPRAELCRLRAREARDAFLRAATLSRALEALNGIEYAVLKGAALMGRLYQNHAERFMWDVDVLVATESDRDLAGRRLEREGFRPGKDLSAHHHAPAWKDPAGGFGVEVHTNLLTPPLPDRLVRALWDRRVRPPDGRMTLDPAGQLIHHAIHALNDPLLSPLFRNLFETAWLAERLDLEQRRFVAGWAAEWAARDWLARALWLAHDLFGSPPLLDRPPQDRVQRWCEWRLRQRAPLNLIGRIARHIGQDDIRRIRRGVPSTGIGPVAGGAIRFIAESARQRLASYDHPPRRAEGTWVRVGDCGLFQSGETGEVHLLNAGGARAFESLRGDHAVLRELRRRGILE